MLVSHSTGLRPSCLVVGSGFAPASMAYSMRRYVAVLRMKRCWRWFGGFEEFAAHVYPATEFGAIAGDREQWFVADVIVDGKATDLPRLDVNSSCF